MDKSLLYEHKMTQDEMQECKEIVNIISDIVPFYRLSVGNPIYKATNSDGSVRYLAGGDCYDSLFCIKKEDGYGFNYYIVEVGDRGYFGFTDFQDKWLLRFKEYTTIHYDALIYYFINVRASLHNCYPEDEIIFYNGYCLKATKKDNNYYSFNPVHGYGSGMAMDEVVQYGCSFMEPVFLKEKCLSCNHEWWFNTRNIPQGERYETTCPKCKMMLKRKKI